MKWLIIFTFQFPFYCVYAQEEPEFHEKTTPLICLAPICDQAYFPGGHDSLLTYFNEHIQLPQRFDTISIDKRVRVCFVVNQLGKASIIAIRDSFPECPECIEQVYTAFNNMPLWKPGGLDGKISTMSYCIPIHFSNSRKNKT